jgi:hypothetical protein
MTRRLFVSNNPEEEEVPCLANSDTSPDNVGSFLGDSSTEFTSCQSDSEDEHLIVRGRRVIDRSNKLASASRQRHRSRSPAAPRSAAQQGSHSQPRSAARQRSRSRPRSSSRARSRSRPKSSAPEAARPNARFSHSRRTSIGGTTVFRTPYMSQLDAFLQTTSGLRLETNGKCTFLFEGQRFLIEAEGESTGDILFYASLGPLKKLQHINRPKNLLRLMASWNEELKERRGVAQDQEEGQENSGLLRIDSSMPDGPHVALIYYGHLDNIVSAALFQDKLDDFVDDAIEYSHKILGTKKKIDTKKKTDAQLPSDYRNNMISRSCSPSSRSSVDSDNERSKVYRDTKNSNTKTSKEPPMPQEKSATFAAPTTATTTATATATITNNNSDSFSTEVASSSTTPKTSIFTKVISSLHRPHINLGYQEKDCFVIDRQTVEEGNFKPTIVLSRVGEGGEKREESSMIGDQHDVKKKSSFHDNGTANDYYQGCSRPRKGMSFHMGDETPSGPDKPSRRSSSFIYDDHGGRYHHSRRGSSFRLEENGNRHHDQIRKNGTSSFHMDDGPRRGSSFRLEENGYRHHDQIRKNGTSSFHMDDGRSDSVARTARSKSFHSSQNERPKNTNLAKIKSKSFHSSFMDDELDPESSTKIVGRSTKRHSVHDEKLKVDKVSGSHRHHQHSSGHTSAYW